MAQGYTATDLANLVATSTEVLCSYEDVRLSTSTSAPPKKPSVKVLLRVCTFTDVKQRIRFTFLKNSRSRKVLADAVLLSLEGSGSDENIVELRFYDFGEYVDSFASSFAVVARRMWFSVKGYSATSFNSAVLRLAAIPVARLVQPEPQGPAVQMSQHHRPANPQRQHSAPRAAIQSTVRSDITLDAAFATAGRAKQLDDDGKLTAAVLAYEQCAREFQAVVANAEKNKLSSQHVELILSKARAFAARASAIRQQVAAASSAHVAAVAASPAKTWGNSQEKLPNTAPRPPLPGSAPAASVEERMLQRLAELQAQLPPEDNNSNQDKQQKFLRRIENLKENATRQHHDQRKSRDAADGLPGGIGGSASAGNRIVCDDDAVHLQLMKRLDLMKRSLEDSIRTQDAEKAQAAAKLKEEFKPGTRVRVVAAQQLRSLIETNQDPRVGISWDDRLKLLGGREGIVCSHVFEPGAAPLLQIDVSVVLPSSRTSTARVLLFPEALVKRHWWDAPTPAPAAVDESTTSPVTSEVAGNIENERFPNSESAAGVDSPDTKAICRARPAAERETMRPGSQTATAVRPASPTTQERDTLNGTFSQDSSTVVQSGSAVEELEIAEDVGSEFVSNPEAGRRRPAGVRDQSDDVSDALWARVERVAETVEDCVTDTEDLMRESTSDRMSQVRRRRQAITKLSQLSQQLEAVLAAAGRTSSTISAHGQTRVAAAQTLNDARRALAVYAVEFPPEVETAEARRSNAGKVGSQAFGITAGVVGGAAAVATAGVAVAGGIAAPRLAGVATVGTALAGGVAAVAVGAVVGGTAAAIAAVDHAVKRDRAKKRRQRQAARVGYDWSDDDGLQDDYSSRSEDEQSVDSAGSAY